MIKYICMTLQAKPNGRTSVINSLICFKIQAGLWGAQLKTALIWLRSLNSNLTYICIMYLIKNCKRSAGSWRSTCLWGGYALHPALLGRQCCSFIRKKVYFRCALITACLINPYVLMHIPSYASTILLIGWAGLLSLPRWTRTRDIIRCRYIQATNMRLLSSAAT